MNILYLCDEYPPGRHGGIGTAVQLLARQMAKDGHKVVVAGFYTWGYGQQDEEDDNGVKVYRFRRGLDSAIFSDRNAFATRVLMKALTMAGIFNADIKRSLKKYQLFLEDIITRHGIDIIEMPDYQDYFDNVKEKVLFPSLSRPVVVKIHTSYSVIASLTANKKIPAYIPEMERDLIDKASGVSSVSKYAGELSATSLKYNKDIRVLYNGINTDVSFDRQEKQPHRVIFTGTLVPLKGIYQLIKAWKIVHSNMPDAQLVVLGKGGTDKLMTLLSPEAKKTVTFPGHVSRQELFSYISGAMVAVLPSYMESFGLAAVEAILCGTAVIFTNRAAGPEVIKDGVTGLLVDPDDINSIAEKIEYLLKNPQVCNELVTKAHEDCRQRFDIRTVAAENLEYYKEVLNN